MTSCQEILFSDEESTREILLKDFHAAEIRGVFNIILIQDSSNRLVITGKKDIRSIDAFVDGDTLIIDDPVKMSFNTKRNTIAIHFSNLSYLATFNPVNVTNEDTIKADLFEYAAIVEVAEVSLLVDCNNLAVISANTLGHFNLSGRAGYCTIVTGYGCSFFAGDLSCRHADIIHESIGDVYINASESITAYIRGPGNIYYHGNPLIEIAEKRGNGKLIRID
jgi:hypothetical protein